MGLNRPVNKENSSFIRASEKPAVLARLLLFAIAVERLFE
jgi:hypothetical protein